MARYTVAEVADKLGVAVEVARGLVKFLVEVEMVERVGNRKPESGRGQPSDVFQFTDGFEARLQRLLKRADLV